jgi:hypothetical protein
MSMPIAAIETLASLISASSVSTVQELFSLLEGAAEELKKASFNPISLASGTQLLLRFLTIQRLSPDQSFDEFKTELVKRAREFVEGSGRCRDIIAAHITTFVKDDSVSNQHRNYPQHRGSRLADDDSNVRRCRPSWCTPTRYVRLAMDPPSPPRADRPKLTRAGMVPCSVWWSKRCCTPLRRRRSGSVCM